MSDESRHSIRQQRSRNERQLITAGREIFADLEDRTQQNILVGIPIAKIVWTNEWQQDICDGRRWPCVRRTQVLLNEIIDNNYQKTTLNANSLNVLPVIGRHIS